MNLAHSNYSAKYLKIPTCHHTSHSPIARHFRRALIFTVALSLPVSLNATYTFETYGKEISRNRQIDPLPIFGEFGDQTEYSTGVTTFRKTVVELKGSNDIRVAVDYIIKQTELPSGAPYYVLQRDIPYIEGRHGTEHGWVVGRVPANYTNQRCSDQRAFSTLGYAAEVQIWKPVDNILPDDYWSGNKLYLPEGGGGFVRKALAHEVGPAGAEIKWATNSGWLFSCYTLPDGSEGFLGHRNNGQKYYFGTPVGTSNFLHILSPARTDADGWLSTDNYRMHLTRIEDRFGNWVNYDSSGISSSDGRIISITSAPSLGVNGALIQAHGREWKMRGALGSPPSWTGSVEIENPDSTVWRISTSSGGINEGYSALRHSCSSQANIPMQYSGQLVIDVTTESRLTGTFVFQPRRHGFSYVPFDCKEILSGYKEGTSYSNNMHFLDGISLVTRSVTGIGVSYSHSIDYGPINSCYVPGPSSPPPDLCSANSPTTRTVTVTGSDGLVRTLTYGNKFSDNSGVLFSQSEGNLLLTSFEHINLYSNSTGAGNSAIGYNIGTYSVIRDRKKSVALQGMRFISEIPFSCGPSGSSACFDSFYRPTRIVRSSTPVP